MVKHIDGPLYFERMGRTGQPMAFIHPNPMDQSCWLFQMAHFSTWYRCIAMDVPGYGRSPKSSSGLSMEDLAEACWEAIDNVSADEPAILVGCSVGSMLVPYLQRAQPHRTAAMVLTGAGYAPDRLATPTRRIKDYRTNGIGFRWRYTFEDFSPAFRATPLAHYFAELFTERNDTGDVDSIVYQFEALSQRDPEMIFDIDCPTLILTGSEDNTHPKALAMKERLPNAVFKVLPGAGHACQLEQPWLFDRFLREFLEDEGLFPSPSPLMA